MNEICQEIENYIQLIFTYCEQKDDKRAADRVKGLSNFLLNHEYYNNEKSIIFSLIFQSNQSITKSFDMIREHKMNQTREMIIMFIGNHFEQFSDHKPTYHPFIFNLLWNVIRSNDINSVKIASFKPIEFFIKNSLIPLQNINNIIRTLFNQLNLRQSSHVKGGFYRILGYISNIYHESFADQAIKYSELCLNALQKQKEIYQTKGFEKLLVEDWFSLTSLYQFLVFFLNLEDETRYALFHSALLLLSNHASLFSSFIIRDIRILVSLLILGVQHSNREVRQHCLNASEEILKETNIIIVSEIKNNQVPEYIKTGFLFCMEKFYQLIISSNDQKSSEYQIGMAIRCIGQLAPAIRVFYNQAELKILLHTICNKTEHFLSGTIHNIKSQFFQFPHFLSSIALLIKELEEIDNSFLFYFELLLSRVFQMLIYSIQSLREKLYPSTRLYLMILYTHNRVFHDIIPNVIYQGLLLTITPLHEKIKSIGLDNRTCFEEYFQLWIHLFDNNIPKIHFNESLIKEMQQSLFFYIINHIQDIINNFNFTYVPKDIEKISSSQLSNNDIHNSIVPAIPNDIALFLNLVEFLKLFLPSINPEFFIQWIHPFGCQIIELSIKYPLISGFYKLFDIILQLCDQVGFFSNIHDDTYHIKTENNRLNNFNHLTHPSFIYSIFSSFLKDVVIRLKQYRDELLFSCLNLVLKAPLVFIDIPFLVPSLQKTFEIGLSYTPSAILGLDVLEKWISEIPLKLKPHLINIVPFFRSYLQPPNIESFSLGINIPQKGTIKDNNEIVIDRILPFLGKIGGYNIYIIPPKPENILAFDSTKKLIFPLPFLYQKLDIILDPFIPRILFLSEKSTHRKTKISACELLHSILIYIFSHSNQNNPNSPNFIPLYQHIFPVILRLGVDSEHVTRLLFRNFIFQIIHWFSQKNRDPQEVSCFLDAITHAIGNPSDGALREFSSLCFGEFFNWAVKHHNQKSISSLFRRLNSLAHHPDSFKRLGASLTYLSIYKYIREEQDLIDEYFFDIMQNLIFSLSLSDNDDPSVGTTSSLLKVFQHMKRIVTNPHHGFSQVLRINKNNRQGNYSDLQQFLLWIFHNKINRPETTSRRVCMQLLQELSPFAIENENIITLTEWMKNYIFSSSNYLPLITVFEKPLQNLDQSKLINFSSILSWLDNISISLDCYIWFLKECNISEDENATILKSSSLLNHLVDFLQYIHSKSFDYFESNLLPKQSYIFNTSKCTVMIRLFRFLQLVFNRISQKYYSNFWGIFTGNFFQIFFLCILDPLSQGFHLNSTERINQFQKQISAFGSSLVQISSIAPWKNTMISCLQNLCSSPKYQLLSFFQNIKQSPGLTDFMISGYTELYYSGLLSLGFSQSNLSTITKSLFQLIYQNLSEYKLDHHILIQSKLMKFILSIGIHPTIILEFICNPDHDDDSFTKDENFYRVFSSLLNKYIISNYKVFSDLICNIVSKKNKLFYILLNLFDEYGRHIRKLKKEKRMIIRIPEQQINDQSDTRSFISQFLNSLSSCSFITNISNKSSFESVFLQLQLIKKMYMIDGNTMREESNPFIDHILKIFSISITLCDSIHHNLCKDETNDTQIFQIKNEAITLIPYLLSNGEFFNEPTNKTISPSNVHHVCKKISSLIINAPFDALGSKNLREKDIENYKIMLNNLLESLLKCEHFQLFETLLPIFQEENHRFSQLIEEKITQLILQLSNPGRKTIAFNFLNQLYSLFFRLNTTFINARYFCLKFLTQMLFHLPDNSLIEFFLQNGKQLENIVISSNGTIIYGKNTFLEEEFAYSCLNVLFQRQSIDIIHEYIKINHRDLIKIAYKQYTSNDVYECFKKMKEKPSKNDSNNNNFRSFIASAFCFEASAIICSQIHEKHFIYCFFEEKPHKQEIIWENIIDCHTIISLKSETNFSIKSKNTNILNSLKTRLKKQLNVDNSYFLSSQYLLNSSLPQDIPSINIIHENISQNSQYEIAGTSDFELKEQKKLIEINKTEQSLEINDNKLQKINENVKGDYELDDFNKNPCMTSYLQIIDKLVLIGGSMEKWMDKIKNKLIDNHTHINIKWFIIKIIINRWKIFSHFASNFFVPITSFVIQDNNGGNGFHYFLKDICIVFLQWNELSNFVPSGQIMSIYASRFIELLIENCNDIGESNKIIISRMKNNLDFIFLLINKWKSNISIKKEHIIKFLLSKIKEKDGKVKIALGLQLLGILLSNKYPIYNPNLDNFITEDQYFNILLNLFKCDSKPIYEAVSEIFGMIFNQPNNSDTLGKIEYINTVNSTLQDFYKNQNHEYFLIRLNKIGINCKDTKIFNDVIINFVFDLLNRGIEGPFLTSALQIILWRVENSNTPYYALMPNLTPAFSKIINSRNYNAHKCLLLILIQQNRYLTISDIGYLLKLHDSMKNHVNEQVRSLYYYLIICMYKEHNAFFQPNFIDTVLTCLIDGLSDSSLEIREKLYEFWDKEACSDNNDIISRLIFFLNNYSNNSDNYWLQFVSFLLLEATKKSPDFNRLINNQTMENISIPELYIDTEWKKENLPMSTPLFATQDGYNGEYLPLRTGYIVATQKPQFSNSINYDSILVTNPSSQSSMIFGDSQGISSAFSFPAEYHSGSEVFYDENDVPMGSFAEIIENKTDLKKTEKLPSTRFRPFSFTPAVLSRDIKKRQQHKVEEEEKERISKKVNLFRKYREGELPVTLIPNKDIILPLQSLSCDPYIAKQLFLSLFRAIYQTIESHETKSVIIKAFEKILNKSNCSSVSFLSSIHLAYMYTNDNSIDTTIITETSIKARSIESGILLLENILSECGSNEPVTKKRKKNNVFEDKSIIWQNLARLYAEIGENDIVLGILNKVKIQPLTKMIIRNSIDGGDWNEILSKIDQYLDEYESLDNSSKNYPSQYEVDLWFDERLECFRKLGDWETLYDNIINEVNGDPSNFWNSDHWTHSINIHDNYLRHYLTSSLKAGKSDELFFFIDECLKNKEKITLIENMFSFELASIYAFRGMKLQYQLSKKKKYSQFILNFSQKLNVINQYTLLEPLQTLVEIDEFFYIMDLISQNTNEIELNNQIEKIILSWNERFPSKLFTYESWDDLAFYRLNFFKQILNKKGHVVQPLYISSVTNTFKKAAIALLDQNYYNLSNSFLKQALDISKLYKIPDYSLTILSKQIQVQQSMKLPTSNEKITIFNNLFQETKLLEKETKLELQSNLSYAYTFKTTQFQILENLANIFKQEPYLSTYNATEYYDSARDCLEYITLLSSQVINNDKNDSGIGIIVSKSFSDLGKFCDSQLIALETIKKHEMNTSVITKKNILADYVMRNWIKALLFNSEEIIDRIPRLLEIANFYPDTIEIFHKGMKEIPSWFFLRWVSQLLAYLGSNGLLVVDILKRIAFDYPSALLYPFQLTYEDLSSNDTARSFLDKIYSILCPNIDLMLLFIQSLENLTKPELKYKYYKTKLIHCVKHNKTYFKEIYKKFVFECLNEKKPFIGKYNKEWAKIFQSDFQMMFGEDGKKIEENFDQELLELLESFFKKIDQKVERYKINPGKHLLSDFSEYLYHYYSLNNGNCSLEIPGQYSGYCRPDPDQHIKIVSFHPEITYMKSLRQPVCITIHGNDERDHKWLIKWGEDLRLDQRIEQLFIVMNKILLLDAQASLRKLFLNTYQVIPMNRMLGAIEWLHHTKSVKSIIESNSTIFRNRVFQEVQKQFELSLCKMFNLKDIPKDKNLKNLYLLKSFKDISSNNIITHYQNIVNHFPSDLLLRGISSLSLSSENFITIRKCFASSLAITSIANYVLGIGDRHLENMLVDTCSGTITTIDFGVSFGQGIFQKIPELIPFRLTPQFLHVLHPLGTEGLLKHDMCYVLSAFSSHKSLLFNVLEVFVKEPHLDWVAKANGGDIQFYPQQKIDIVQKKLSGYDSVSIMLSELEEVYYSKKCQYIEYYSEIQKVIKGDKSSLRHLHHSSSNNCASVIDQIEILIDHSTDPVILGRTFIGWCPYL